jgi:hypothetical protein
LTRITPNLQDDEFTRRIADRAAVGRHRRHAALSIARTGQINTRKINGWNTSPPKRSPNRPRRLIRERHMAGDRPASIATTFPDGTK